MSKNKINTILDLVLFMMIISMFIIKGGLHESIAYILGLLLILHVVLHWQQFKALYRQLIPNPVYQKIVAVLVGGMLVALLTMPLYLQVNDKGHNGRPPEFGQYR